MAAGTMVNLLREGGNLTLNERLEYETARYISALSVGNRREANKWSQAIYETRGELEKCRHEGVIMGTLRVTPSPHGLNRPGPRVPTNKGGL